MSSFSNWKHRLRHIDIAHHRPALPAPSPFLPVTVRVVEHAHDESLPIEAGVPGTPYLTRAGLPMRNRNGGSSAVRLRSGGR
jgi:hypothetical protein